MKYKVMGWQSDYEREEGLPVVEGTNIGDLEKAIDIAENLTDNMHYAASEVQTEEEETDAVITFVGRYQPDRSETRRENKGRVFVEICSDCAKKIKNVVPYKYKNGRMVSRDKFVPVIVSKKICMSCGNSKKREVWYGVSKGKKIMDFTVK